MHALALTLARLRRRAARCAGAQVLAGDAPDAPCGRAPRRRADRLRRHASRSPRTRRPPTTRSPRARFGLLSTGLRRRGAAGLDAARRPRRAQRRGARRRAAALGRHGLPARAARRLRARSAALLDLPFELYSTFRIEQRFGFNRMTWRLYLADALKGAAGRRADRPADRRAGAVAHGRRRRLWWLWAWGAWMGFNLLMLVLYPTLIAPLFNKFEPLRRRGAEAARAGADGALRLCAPRACS